MRYTGFPFLTRIRSLIYRKSDFPFSVSSIAFLSGLRISVSPISTASTRLSYNRLISALVLIPLSDTKTTSSGARFRSRMLLFISTRNVRRSRLLTPTIFAPAYNARSTSRSSCASTSASSPRLSASCRYSLSCTSSRIAQIRSTADAPKAFA